MNRSSSGRRSLSAGTAAALLLLAVAGAWHRHTLALPDARALDRLDHGIVSGPCHVCKLSTAGVTLPGPETSASSAIPPAELVAIEPSPATAVGFDLHSPARAPPAPENA